MTSRYKWIIDSGHSGVAFGIYLTDGKRSPEVPPGFYEGEQNRIVAEFLTRRLNHTGIMAVHINAGPVNAREREKADAANRIRKAYPDCRYLAIHHNAAPGAGWSSAQGSAVFHAATFGGKSEAMARVFARQLAEIPTRTSRGVKTANFYILKAVSMPAVLCELGFMTNREEASFVQRNPDLYVSALANAIAEIEAE